jgi:2-octaprenylphenol hydroxylase
MNFQSDICIIGNGLIGKAAALGLAQTGTKVILVDAQPAVALPAFHQHVSNTGWDLRVYALNPAARQLLSDIKVWDALDATRITPVESMIVAGESGDRSGRLDFDAYGARVDALAWIVEDRHLNAALDTALKFSTNVQCIQQTALTLAIEENAAVVSLGDGSAVHTELVIGADGANSWVRMQAGIGVDYRSYREQAIVANFSCERPHRGAAYQWFTDHEGIIALLPLAGDQVSLVWSAPNALAETLLSESAEALAARISDVCKNTLGTLQPLGAGDVKILPLALWRPHTITAPRVALIGDAAHVIHPLAGQGMNLGFADVVALLKALNQRGQYRSRGDARVLSNYARHRREDIFLMQLATDGLQRLFASEFEPVRIVRNFGLNLVNNLPALKRRLITHAMGRRF